MNREVTKVVPFRTAASPYNAEIEKKRNVIGQQLAKAVRDCGYSKKAFCEVLKNYGVDVTHSALGKWTNGLTVPSAYQLVAICHSLHIEEGISYFTGSYVSELNEVGMAKMRSYRDDLIASGRYRPQSKDDNQIRYISKAVSNLCVSAGTGAFLDEGNYEMVSFPENAVPPDADFGVRVSGDSMEPVYHDGQIVWVQKCETLSVGQVGIFVYDGEGYIKRYGEQQPENDSVDAYTDSYGVIHMQPVLISYNRNYADKIVRPENQFEIVGRVL